MKKELVILFLSILCIVICLSGSIALSIQNKTYEKEIELLKKEAKKTFSIDEAMFIYKEGHRKGALRVTGNYLNFLKMYNPAEFETDSLYYRSVLEKSVK